MLFSYFANVPRHNLAKNEAKRTALEEAADMFNVHLLCYIYVVREKASDNFYIQSSIAGGQLKLYSTR